MEELSFGNILNQTFEEYKKHFGVFIKILLLLYLLPSAILTVITQVFSYSIQAVSLTNDMTAVLALGIPGIIFIFVVAIANLVLLSLVYIAIIKIVTYRRANEEVTIRKILDDSKKYIGPYAILSLLTGLALFCLFLLLIIPGIIFLVYWSFALYILILENKGVTESLSESKRLVSGRWWKVFGYNLLFGLIIIGISFGLGLVIGIPSVFLNFIPVVGPVISQILNDTLTMFILPLGIIFGEIFYQKLKSMPAVAGKK